MSVLDFPIQPGRRRDPIAALPHLYSITTVGAQVGIVGVGLSALVRKLRVLVDKRDFPPPATPHIVKGEVRTGADAITPKSLWRAEAVDAWVGGDTPPPVAAAIATARTRDAAQRMDAAAAALFDRADAA